VVHLKVYGFVKVFRIFQIMKTSNNGLQTCWIENNNRVKIWLKSPVKLINIREKQNNFGFWKVSV
jgi:hypothetical protein